MGDNSMGSNCSAADVLNGDTNWAIEQGDCRRVLATLPDASVHCCICSPPYFGLRSYLKKDDPDKALEMGLESTVEEFVAALVDVFDGVRRVLRDDGTLWLNLGDSYCTVPHGPKGANAHDPKYAGARVRGAGGQANRKALPGVKHKDLLGIPWQVAFALRDAGWYLRSAAPWIKRNAMCESIKDRPSSAVEYVFLLTKRAHYFYDIEAVREPLAPESPVWGEARSNLPGWSGAPGANGEKGHSLPSNPAGRNRRNSDWFFESWQGLLPDEDGDPLALVVNPVPATRPFKGVHFAMFPPKLIEPMVKAGTSEKGCCPKCGSQWQRIVSRPTLPRERDDALASDRDGGLTVEQGWERSGMTHYRVNEWYKENPTQTVGWEPGCNCGEPTTVPAIVLDPFSGAATTLLVSRRLGRRCLGIELDRETVKRAEQRLREDLPLFNTEATDQGGVP